MENNDRNPTNPNGDEQNEPIKSNQNPPKDPNKKEDSQSEQKQGNEDDVPDYSNLDIDESTGGSGFGDPEDGEPEK